MNNEDIKILEEFIKYYEAEAISRKFRGTLSIQVDEDDIQAIENLLNRNKDLEEDNYTYHQLMRMQNEREYRSKFLKDFQEENGKNVMPDYDEIYKRYDKQKKQLKNSVPVAKIKEKIEKLDTMIEKINRGELQKYTVSEIFTFKAIYEKLLEEK